MTVLVVPPDPAWPEQFAAERARLSSALHDIAHEIQPIGSTAIQGIYAKPVIDMLLEVDDLAALDQRSAVFVALGYEALGEFGIPGRRYFRRDSTSGRRTHQLHAFVRGSAGAVRHRAFREYMNAHPHAAQEYSELKRQLAAEHPQDMQAYMDGKDAFVKHHEALALQWYAAEGSDS